MRHNSKKYTFVQSPNQTFNKNKSYQYYEASNFNFVFNCVWHILYTVCIL